MPTAGAFGAKAVVKMLAASRSGALRLIRPPLYREHGESTSYRRARKRLSRSERSPAKANHGSHFAAGLATPMSCRRSAHSQSAGMAYSSLLAGRSISSYEGTWVVSDQDSNAAPQTVQTASPVCGTKNFSSVRLYSAPQLH